MASAKLSESVVAALARVGPADIAIGLLTYNSAETLDSVVATAPTGWPATFPR